MNNNNDTDAVPMVHLDADIPCFTCGGFTDDHLPDCPDLDNSGSTN